MSTSTIDPQAPVITLINVFTVPREKQSELIDLLNRATEEVMRHQPGFISANIHRGLDGVHVANYAQWRSQEDMQRMLANPEAQVHMRQATAIAKAEPTLYTVDSSHT